MLLKSMLVETCLGVISFIRFGEPRSRTSTVLVVSSGDLELCRNIAIFERNLDADLRRCFACDRDPQHRCKHERKDLEKPVVSDPVLERVHSQLSRRCSAGAARRAVRRSDHLPFESVTQPKAERIRIQKSFDLTIVSKRYRAAFFGNDDGHSVGFFGDADRRSVARSEFLAQSGLDGERKKARGCGNAPVLNNHGSIVQRHCRIEDRNE